MLWLYCDCSDTSLWIFCWRKKTGAQQDGETNIFDGCTMQCTSNWSSGSCCQAPAAPLPPASPAPMTTPVFYLPSTFDFFTRRLQRLLSLAQCHATAKVSNDEAEKDIMMAEIRSRAEYDAWRHCRELVSRKKLPIGYRPQRSATEGRCCQTLWRHGLTFNILHLTLCKKVGYETWQSVFSFFCNIIRIGHSAYAIPFIGLQSALSKI